ncbi:hypothetical protein ACFWIW_10875 [Amycolatopsis sp. NPDC058340]|uniref:hypothetical protein n=1 Tax=Amycolatopsis sp. NPDC058340 TaxID=3346453 RepID=UPI00364E3A7E
MTLDPGQPTKEVDLAHVKELAREGAWFLGAIAALLFLGWSDQITYAMAYIAVNAKQPPEPPQ